MIAALYPEAKFIQIIRDGRGVVASLARKGWVDFDQANRIWVRFTTLGREFGRGRPSRYHELRYEDLIADDAAVGGRVLEFLGLEPDPGFLAFCRQQGVERTPFQEPMRSIDGGVEHSDWPLLFDRESKLRSLDVIGDKLVELGYETEASLAELRGAIAAGQHGAAGSPSPGSGHGPASGLSQSATGRTPAASHSSPRRRRDGGRS